MLSRFILCGVVGVLLVLPPQAGASPDPGNVVAVEGIGRGTESRCPIVPTPESCPFTWDTNGTLAPGDDKFHSSIFVDDARVTVRPPVGNAPPQRITLDPSQIVIEHPANRRLNETWLSINDTRPDAIRPWLAFESRPERDYNQDGSFTEDDWGLFLTLYLPPGERVANHDSAPLFSYCWDTCYLSNQLYFRGNETAMRPFPNGVFGRYYEDQDVNSDYAMDRKVYEAENCMFEPYAPCDPSAAYPAMDSVDQAYHGATPEISGGIQFNKTSIIIHPDDGPTAPESPSTLNVTNLQAGALSNVTLSNASVSGPLVSSTPPPSPSSGIAASFTFTTSGASVSVDASPTTDPSGNVTDYAWEWDDGETSHGPTATHTYAVGGAHTIHLTATDEKGDTGSVRQTALTPIIAASAVVTVSAAPAAGEIPLLLEVAAGASLAVLVALLYARIRRQELPEQETRGRILAAVAETPGLRVHEIAARIGRHPTTVAFHVEKLKDAGHLRFCEGGKPRIFPRGLMEPDASVSAVLAQPTLRAILAVVTDRGEVDHVSLAAAVGITRSNVSRHLAELAAVGLVTQARVGRRLVVRPNHAARGDDAAEPGVAA